MATKDAICVARKAQGKGESLALEEGWQKLRIEGKWSRLQIWQLSTLGKKEKREKRRRGEIEDEEKYLKKKVWLPHAVASCEGITPKDQSHHSLRDTPSGNSFGNLIPFSKNPYKESDCGNEVAEFVRKEKRQKQMESVADDLFNSVKVHRHGTTGFSIRDLLTRR